MVIPLRVVEGDWECERSGNCCTIPDRVVMTYEERAVLNAHLGSRAMDLKWDNKDLPLSHTGLVAKPCPLYGTGSDGLPGCTVYSVRPYNCRRFSCLKPQTRDQRRFLERYQRKAQRWALRHGWTAEMVEHKP